jgi:hypothetical protein
MKSITLAAAAAFSCLALAACSNSSPNTPPNSVSSGGTGAAPSGITSSNGGGMRQTGAIPNVGVTSGQATTTGVPNSKGAAY